MTIRMFQLEPGGSIRYRVRPVGGPGHPELELSALRPDEGASTTLELSLVNPATGFRCAGRVALDEGYLAVVLEVRRQIAREGSWGVLREFDLVRVDEGERRAAAGI
jgi:hypothetical protein